MRIDLPHFRSRALLGLALAIASVLVYGPFTKSVAAEPRFALDKDLRLSAIRASHARMPRAPKHPGYRLDHDIAERTTGLVESGNAPLPGIFDIENQWHGAEGNLIVDVYAGSLRSTGQGIIVIIRRAPALHRASTPTVRMLPVGPVRIAAMEAGNILLRDRSGRTFSIARPETGALLAPPR